MAQAQTGRCLCGAVTFVGQGTASAVHVCHCADCQHWHGGPALGVEFAGGIEITGQLSWYQSSDWGERGFCPNCGSSVFYRLRDQSYINTAIGFLDDPGAIQPIALEIFTENQPACYAFQNIGQDRLTGQQFFERIGTASND